MTYVSVSGKFNLRVIVFLAKIVKSSELRNEMKVKKKNSKNQISQQRYPLHVFQFSLSVIFNFDLRAYREEF